MRKLTILLVTFGIFLIYPLSNLNAWIWANEGCIIFYPDPCEENNKSGLSMGQQISDAALHFFGSMADYINFVKFIELTEVDNSNLLEMSGFLNSSIEHMKTVTEIYTDIVNESKNYSYNPVIVTLLKDFDYDAFQEKNNLNGLIFQDVKSYLIEGNGKGIFNRLFNDVNTIFNGLNNIKVSMDSKIIPKVEELWKLNQKFANSMLFGQYVTMVYQEVKKSINETP